jgi:amino acid transporter
MSLKHETNALGEKHGEVPVYEPATLGEHARGRQFSIDPEDRAMVETDQNVLHRDLKGRHMQMIAM